LVKGGEFGGRGLIAAVVGLAIRANLICAGDTDKNPRGDKKNQRCVVVGYARGGTPVIRKSTRKKKRRTRKRTTFRLHASDIRWTVSARVMGRLNKLNTGKSHTGTRGAVGRKEKCPLIGSLLRSGGCEYQQKEGEGGGKR